MVPGSCLDAALLLRGAEVLGLKDGEDAVIRGLERTVEAPGIRPGKLDAGRAHALLHLAKRRSRLCICDLTAALTSSSPSRRVFVDKPLL